MEAAKQQEATGLLGKIHPPRLEDAGLEDCALPPDSIKEAFLKAASAVKSRAASVFTGDEDEGNCVQDPWPEAKDVSDVIVGVKPPEEGASDKLVGIDSGIDGPGPCVGGKSGGLVEEGVDKVVVVGGGEVEEGGKAIDDGVKGSGIGEEKEEKGGDDEEEEEEEKKKPILTGGFV